MIEAQTPIKPVRELVTLKRHTSRQRCPCGVMHRVNSRDSMCSCGRIFTKVAGQSYQWAEINLMAWDMATDRMLCEVERPLFFQTRGRVT